MDLILLEKIKHLGDLGDVVKVKPGYGRNYLMPKGKALPATAKNKEVFEVRKAELVEDAEHHCAAVVFHTTVAGAARETRLSQLASKSESPFSSRNRSLRRPKAKRSAPPVPSGSGSIKTSISSW